MAFDGFLEEHKQAFGGYSAELAERVLSWVEGLGQRLHIDVEGIDNLPVGGAVIVSNHTFGVWDVPFAIARIRAVTGRTVWSLGEHLWWKIPVLRRLAAAFAVVDGSQENADAILSAHELLLVMPGGLREALKPKELRYRLLWGHRYGFVRAALRNGVPLVPMACVGADDLFDIVGNAFVRGRRLHLPIPLPRATHVHRAKVRILIGEAIETRGRPDDERTIRALRREVEGALHELIEDELAHRVAFPT